MVTVHTAATTLTLLTAVAATIGGAIATGLIARRSSGWPALAWIVALALFVIATGWLVAVDTLVWWAVLFLGASVLASLGGVITVLALAGARLLASLVGQRSPP